MSLILRIMRYLEVIFQSAVLAAQPLGVSAAGDNLVMFSNTPPETIEAKRRRKSSGPSGRAEMPSRPSQSGGTSGGTGGGTPSSGGGLGNLIPSGGKRSLPIGCVVVLIIGYLIFSFLTKDTQPDTTSQNTYPTDDQQLVIDTPQTSNQEVTAAATSTKRPTKKAATSAALGTAQTWTIMLYADADDSVLEQDIYMDLNEAEKVGSTDQVNLVAQVDRFAGAYTGDGDWTGTRRYYLTQDDDLTRLSSQMVADLGELSMSDPKTLVDFVTWAIKKYPADKYVLILSDHGMGWPGGWTDPKPSALRSVNVPFAQAIKQNLLYTNDVDDALAQITQQTGVDRFEMVGMDACLMSQLEVFSALAPYARYVITSEETEPSLGWAYTAFLTALVNNPGMDGAELGSQIVSTFISKDERIMDAKARMDFLRQGSPMGSLFGQPADVDPAVLARQLSKSITLTAADMDALPGLIDSVNQLVMALQNENQSVVARARTYSQSYTSIFGKDVPPSYIDLGSFVQLLAKESSSSAVRSAANTVLEQIQQVVIAEKHGSEKPGSTGVSIYFPNSQLYQNAMAGPRSYTKIADRFVSESLWDDFLAFHYTRTPFTNETGRAVVPDENTRAVAPGKGQIDVSQLRLSLSEANYDQSVTLEADLQGTNIGYVYLFIGWYDSASQSILLADKDYLESPTTQQIGELFYPKWSDNENFTLSFSSPLTVFAIDDGQQTVVALLKPELYGATADQAVYSTDGVYTIAGTGETRYARMYFSAGQLLHVYGYTSQEPIGALSEITPQTGDTITLINTWLVPDGSGGYTPTSENGDTLTFSDHMFTWTEQYLATGDYVVGFVVSDLDGNEKTTLGAIHIK